MDLLVLLFLAVLIGVRLWQVLGQKPDGESMSGTVFLKERDVKIKKHKIQKSSSDFFPDFDESDFLEGAEAAFMMILKAHQTRDQKVLKRLVDSALLKTIFKDPPKEIPSNMCLTAVSIDKKYLEKNEAFVVVHFFLDQAFGDQTISSQDIWTFKRDIKNDDPNWMLTNVSSK